KMAMVEVEKDIEWHDLMYDMGAGWNLGNTLDAKNVNTRNELNYEGSWIKGGKTTPEMIKTLKEAGFKTIRVPVSWHNHVDEIKGDDGHYTFTIHDIWLDRVQEVVDYCYNEGLYVIINIHHDDYTDYYVYPDAAHAERSFDYMRSIWSQLAERFGDYDYHLIFETMNEVRITGNNQWNPTAKDALTAQTYINEFNRIAVETIRNTPGEYNISRYIGCPGFVSSIDAITSTFALPFDPSPYENRLMVPIHAYVNWNFVSADTKTFTSGIKSEITTSFNKISKRLTEKDVPCYIGEWGVTLGQDNVEARSAYVTHYLEKAATACKDSEGNIVRIPCVLWDNTDYGGAKAGSEKFGFFDRANLKFHEEEYMKLIMEATYKDYTK
ncbi:MAG: glycoside hydrolase family 5 protein, partial [Lachnospiraceae bacterium]|nr:glycoside hydrolase family 5 protein [Lachnospiraceae bacterium]